MSDPLFDGDHKANTPLLPEERGALIPSYITLQRELNEVEQINIANGDRWAFGRLARHDVLDEEFLCELHKRMYGDVWRWAGQFRTTPRNIGVEAWNIAPDLRTLRDDVRFWIEHKTYPPHEIAVRFHHRLVFIHPFPNGNGRFSRLAADMLAVRLGQPRLSWGSGNLVTATDLRRRYIDALQSADRGEIEPLLAFARS
jgi:Fic-DOC domain mobile mystery protein B